MQSYQRFQCIGHTVFNTSGTNGPRSLSQTKVGTHSAFGERSHTAAHTPKQEPSLPRPQCGFVPPAKFFLFRHAFISATVLSQTIFHRDFQLLPQTAHVRFHRRKWVHTHLCSKDRTQGLTRRNRGCFGWGWHHYPRYELHVHEHPRAGYQDGKLCRFGVLAGGALEERRKPAGQRCAYACRCPTGVAAPPGCVIFFVSVEVAACTPYSRYFFRFSRRSSLCCSCANLISARSFSLFPCFFVMVLS